MISSYVEDGTHGISIKDYGAGIYPEVKNALV